MLVTKQNIIRWISEGRGEGHQTEYTPWLLIERRQSPTDGSLQWRYVPQFKRYFHLMSKEELHVVRFLLWLGVMDIRDQFPCWPWPHPHPLYLHPNYHPATLPWSEGTLSCAEKLGIKHPVYPGTTITHIPTLDILVTLLSKAGSLRAVSVAVKPEEKSVPLTNEDLEKLAIQKEYSSRLDIPFKLMSGSMIPRTLASNLSILIHYSSPLDEFQSSEWHEFVVILNSYISPDMCINQSLKAVENKTKLNRKTVLYYFHKALWFRTTQIDLRHAIVMTAPPILSDYLWLRPTIDYVFGEDK